MLGLSTVRRFLRSLEPWPKDFPKLPRGYAPICGVDYEVPPEVAAEAERRRAGRRIIITNVDEEGVATYGYEGDAPEWIEPKAQAKAS